MRSFLFLVITLLVVIAVVGGGGVIYYLSRTVEFERNEKAPPVSSPLQR